MRIRLIRKFALRLNGIDLSDLRVGDVVELPESAARILVGERWAESVAETIAPAPIPPPALPPTT